MVLLQPSNTSGRLTYQLQMGKRDEPSYDAKTGNLIEYFRYVKVTSNGQSKDFQVGVSIIKSEEHFAEFLKIAVEPWVRTTLP